MPDFDDLFGREPLKPDYAVRIADERWWQRLWNWLRRKLKRSRCTYGVDTCDGPDGSSYFMCNDCAEDADNAISEDD